MAKLKLKSGVSVKVISGKFRGLIGNIHHREPKKERVYLAEAIRKQYNKSPDLKKKSQLKDILVPIHISNVAVCEEKKQEAVRTKKTK